MTNFYIEYNPYLVNCTFKKNDKALCRESKLAAKSSERLQVLLGQSANWSGLVEEIVKACNDKEIRIVFKGRKIDFDDLKYCIDRYKGEVKFGLELIESKNDNDIIHELDTIFSEIKDKHLPQFEKKNKDGKDIFKAYEEVKNGKFEVSVIATMSSGKSTLINSLLHTELLPSENQACTATIVRILDNDDMEEYTAKSYDKDKKVVHSCAVVDLSKLKEYNSDEKVQYIDIEGNIPSIPSDKIRLCLKDTPGPNNSRNENHGRLTRSIIKEDNSIVLYIINATQLGIQDDNQLLRDISNEMKRAGKQSHDRFIFVINKCDGLDEGKGETLDKILSSVTDYLKGLNIIDPILIPTTAKMALSIWKKQNEEPLTRNERMDLNQINDFVDLKSLHYEEYATLTPTVRDTLRERVEKYHSNEETWDSEALIHTGVPAVEETIKEYIEKYAYPIKINKAIKDIVQILDELNMKATFDKAISSDSEQLKRVRKQIQDAQTKYNDSKSLYDNYKKNIEDFCLNIDQDEELLNAERELQKLTKEYDHKVMVDKNEADIMIEKFQEKLEEYQNKCESRLNREIDDKLFHRCSVMLNKYSETVKSILDNIKIDGFNFQKLSSFNRIKISNVNEIIKQNETERIKNETKLMDNPERAGFIGFFKFWKPKKISYTVQIKEGVDVNVKNVIVDIMQDFSSSITDNISMLFDQAEAQIRGYKTAFLNNINNLDTEIGNILSQLDMDTAESNNIETRVKKNQELADWIARKENEIRTLLTF